MQKVRQAQHDIPYTKRQAVVHVIQIGDSGSMTIVINEKFVAMANADGTWKIVSDDVPLRMEDGVYMKGRLMIPRAAIKITPLPEDDEPDATLWQMEVDI